MWTDAVNQQRKTRRPLIRARWSTKRHGGHFSLWQVMQTRFGADDSALLMKVYDEIVALL
jgi:hypothetical protein